MTDDIVTRLRFALTHFRDDPQPVLLEEAADEIERLRAELDDYRERNAWVERHD